MAHRKQSNNSAGHSPTATQLRQPGMAAPSATLTAGTPWTSTVGRRLRPLLRSHGFHLLIAFVIGLLPGLYLYEHSHRSTDAGAPPSAASLQTTPDIVKAASRHIVLPSGEQPTVATVSDASKVHNQAFFAHAANGDKVLVYAQAKEAYLYRPSIDRIIEVAPLAPNTAGSPAASGQTTQ